MYLGADGRVVRDPETLRRIKALAIPPAWTEVWICPSSMGHIQATGRDARRRKQYRYHARWRQQRDEAKYGRTIAFGKALPRIRARCKADVALPGLPRAKVLATVVRLLETTFIRVGNDEYARQNNSFGLTTLRDCHVDIAGSEIRFRFRGKSGKQHDVAINDPQLAKIVKRCRDIPGQELFQFVDDDGKRQTIDSADVNDYIREIAGQEFTAKDFRTWAGTVLAAMALQEFRKVDSHAQAKKNIVKAIERVAQRLGNTVTICRRCYVHPAVLDSYMDGEMVKTARKRVEGQMRRSLHRLPPEEAAVLALLQRRLASDKKGDRLEKLLKKSVVKEEQRRRRRRSRLGRGRWGAGAGGSAAAQQASPLS